MENIKKYLFRWSAPYSPFSPLELSEIYSEMEKVAQNLSPEDINSLVLLLNEHEIQDDAYQTVLMDFFSAFMKFNSNEYVIEFLLKKYSENKDVNIVSMIGFSRDKSIFNKLANSVNFDNLNTYEKYVYIDAIQNIGSPLAIKYLNELKEKYYYDIELTNEIYIALTNINKI